MAEQTFLELIQGLSEVISTNDIGLEDESALLIVNHQLVLLKHIPSLRRIFMATGVCCIHEGQSKEAVFTRLLQAQLFLGETEGSTFGYYADKEIVMLQRIFPIFELTPKELFEQLKRLVEVSARFRDEIKALTGYAGDEDPFSFLMNAIRV